MSKTVQSGRHIAFEIRRISSRRRRFGTIFAVCTTLIILGATLYPFDFTTEGYNDRLDACLQQRFIPTPGLADDVFTNVLLFLPFGFAFAHIAKRRGLTFRKAFPVVLFGGMLLSALVEFLQLYLPFRYTSFIDVYANTAGAGIGFFLHLLFGKRISRHLGEGVVQPNNRKALRWLTAAYVSYFGAALLITIPLLFSVRLTEWDKTFSLSIGNVHSADRPWRGTVERFSFSKYAIKESMVKRTLEVKKLSGLGKDELLCDYRFTNGQTERVRILPPLTPMGSTHSSGSDISKQHWFETSGPAEYLSSWLMATNQFTLLMRLRTAGTAQGGPARIISIDKNPYEANFAITQLGDQLGIRFRSMTTGMGGYSPSFVIPGVFTDTLDHTLLIRSDGLILRVYVDNEDRSYSTILGPGLALFNRFLPTRKTLDITSPVGKLNEVLFIIVAFLPLAYFLTFIALGVRRKSFILFVVVVVTGIAAPTLALNRLFVYMTGRAMTPEYFLTIVILMVLGLAGTWAVQSIKHRRPMELSDSFVAAPATTSVHQL